MQVERARELVPGAHFVCADMTTAEFEPESFDAIVAFYSIINVPLAEQPALLRRFAGWLAPGGWLLAVVGRDPWTGIEENWRGVPGARMYYSHADVAKYRTWLRDAGLAIVEEGREPKNGVPGLLRAHRPAHGLKAQAMRFDYSGWKGPRPGDIEHLRQLMEIYRNLLLQTGGDVDEALRWMEHFGERVRLLQREVRHRGLQEAARGVRRGRAHARRASRSRPRASGASARIR